MKSLFSIQSIGLLLLLFATASALSAQELQVKKNADDEIMLQPQNPSGSLFYGFDAGLSNTGDGNTFIGQGAGILNNTGSRNNFIGFEAGIFNTEGSNNNFFGYQAGFRNTSGDFNNFMGYQSGLDNLTGSRNNFFGYKAGFRNTTGGENTFMGHISGEYNTTGAQNTFIGYRAGFRNSEGAQNTFIGRSAGENNNTGSNNTFLGRNAGHANTTGTGSVFIGYGAGGTETSSNRLYIANSNVDQTEALIYGQFDSKLLRINGTTGINRAFLGTTFNVRSDASDFLLFNAEDDAGNDKFSVKASGTVFVADSMGIGVSDPEADLHIVSGDKPRMLLQSDGTNEESGRVSLRQDNGSGADILYDGSNSDDVFAIETFNSGNSGGKKLTVDLDGNVGIGVDNAAAALHISRTGDAHLVLEADSDNINEEYNPRMEFRQNGGDVKTFLGYDKALLGDNVFGISSGIRNGIIRIDRFGHVGLGTLPSLFGSDVTLAIRAVGGDERAFLVESANGFDRFIVSSDGHVGVNQLFPDITQNIKAIAGDLYALNVEDENGTDRFSVSPSGHVGVNAISTNVTQNIKAIAGDTYVLNVEDENGTDRFNIEPDGEVFIDDKLGIGEASPDGQLHITSNDDATLIIEADSDGGNENDNPGIEYRQDGGILRARSGFDNDEYGENAFAVADMGVSALMIMKPNGDVGIGVEPQTITQTGQSGYQFVSGSKLSVRGIVSAIEFDQIDIEDWPDYVFEEDYELMPLEEVESSIEKNGHLPGIPSAAEVKEDGLKLGAMQVKMMEKIEELTLHLIEMNKKLEAQEAEINRLHKVINH